MTYEEYLKYLDFLESMEDEEFILWAQDQERKNNEVQQD